MLKARTALSLPIVNVVPFSVHLSKFAPVLHLRKQYLFLSLSVA
jgi:hypothetical protein